MSLPIVIYSQQNDILTLLAAKEFIKNKLDVVIVDESVTADSRQLFPASVNFMSFSQAQRFTGSTFVFIDSGCQLAKSSASKHKKSINANSYHRSFEAFQTLAQTGHGKVVWVFSLLSTDTAPWVKAVMTNPAGYQKLLLVGDIYSPLMDTTAKREIVQILTHAAKNMPAPVSSSSSELFIVDEKSAVETLMRAAFSYWYQGKIEAQTVTVKSSYAQVVSELQKWGILLTLAPKDSVKKQLPIAKVTKALSEPKNLIDTVIALQSTPATSQPKVEVKKVRKIKVKTPTSFSIKRPKLLLWFIVIIWIMLTPFLLLASGGVSLAIAANNILQGNTNTTTAMLSYARFSGNVSRTVFSVAGLSELANLGGVVSQSSDLANEAYSTVTSLTKLREGILGKKEYDLNSVSQELSLGLDALYKKVGVLQTLVEKSTIAPAFLPKDMDLTQIRSYLWAGKEIADELPNLISGPTQKSYMVLFQNNMELRPTGGFIGSFALITFDRGKLIDTTVMDVYQADGQLKGHVEPPAAIKNYLGEANWYLRDSNWDPDFLISAKNAQWFLDKELSREVEGVFTIDLYVVKALLDHFGPVRLADFNIELDSKNVYEKIQHEVESEFFPGSTKKATILTDLSESLMAKLFDSGKYSTVEEARLAALFIKSLEQKHMLLTFNNKNAATVVETLGWNGTLPSESGWVTVSDANVGVNKANYFISRNSELKIDLGEENTKYTLSVTLHNNATDELDIKNQYKSYLRAVVSEGEFGDVSIENGVTKETKRPEITKTNLKTEAGVVVSVPPTQSRIVTFTWKTKKQDFSKPGEFKVTLIKQPGTDQDPASIKIAAPSNLILRAFPAADLTQGSTFQYNLNLLEDFTTSVSW